MGMKGIKEDECACRATGNIWWERVYWALGVCFLDGFLDGHEDDRPFELHLDCFSELKEWEPL